MVAMYLGCESRRALSLRKMELLSHHLSAGYTNINVITWTFQQVNHIFCITCDVPLTEIVFPVLGCLKSLALKVS